MRPWFPVSSAYLFGLPNIESGASMNRKQLHEEILLVTYGMTWGDYLWYCLLFGTVGSALISAVTSGAAHTFFSYTFAIGLGIMFIWFLGWFVYGVLRVIIHHLSGGVS
jgi:hypothetical protein